MSHELFDKVKALCLPIDGYAIFGSGPLIIRGIVPIANDLDILCRGDAWEMVSSLGDLKYLAEYDVTVATMADGAITFGTKWGIGDFDVDHLIGSAELIDDLPFVRFELVVEYKMTRGSEKDQQHLDALRADCQAACRCSQLR